MTARVDDKVVAPVTPRVEERVVAPVVVKVDERIVGPVTVKVPAMVGESFKDIVADPPNTMSPPPVRLVPAVSVILLFVKAELDMLVKVLDEPEIVLLIRISVVSFPTKVVVKSGRLIVLVAVGVQVNVPVGPPDWNTI